MKITLLSIFIFTSSIVFAQQEIVGLKSIGVNFNAGWGGLAGFRGQTEIFLGKYVNPKLQVGFNTSFGMSGPGDKFFKRNINLYPNANPLEFPQQYSKDYSLGSNLFAKYFLKNGSVFSPFLYGELGALYHIRKFANMIGDPLVKSSKVFPNASLGLGAKVFLNKSKNLNLEILYSISNPKVFFDNTGLKPKVQVHNTMGNFRIGLHYTFGSKK